ncbi:glycosyltransferase involved in cell wall biosynthesis [Motilibacter rhizosphaerae]|uniref:Glycosyltransferase involved in cell wall biosynthesis n=1 Tax=Motilibacter rhizosphaerae TaxID=598652 RepID=A0A4V2F520_9ACTN|nr:glycosyltransferase [Motilibacter rhizosphaerae]RZS91289.1 glycosyltransferase involved in cell wall biosynthesis [Motilibacter rhizosphaerae]
MIPPASDVVVVVPTLGDRPELLQRCLASLTTQFPHPRILVVAPERAHERVRPLLPPGAELLQERGKGLSAAINTGFAAAGDATWVAWLGDDDALEPGSLRAATAALEGDPRASMAYGGVRFVDGDGRTTRVLRPGRAEGRWLLRWGPNLVSQPGCVFRGTALRAAGPLDEDLRYTMDLDLFLRLQRQGPLVRVPALLASYRWEEGTLTVDNQAESAAEAERVRRRYRRGGPAAALLARAGRAAGQVVYHVDKLRPAPRASRGRSLLVVADTMEGGLGGAARRHAEGLAGEGWTVGLAAPGAGASGVRGAATVELPVPDSAFEVAGMLRAARVLRAVLREQAPRHVHVHGTRSQALALLAGRRPWVTFHGAGRLPGQSGPATAVRQVARGAAPLLSRGALSVSPGVGPGWVHLPTASPALTALERRDAASLAPEPLFVWVGRLSEQKRPEVFVEALALLARTHPSARGVVLGDGPLAARLEDLVQRTGAPVELRGDVQGVAGVAPVLAAAWGFCLFSHFEGVPFAQEEAMWVGVAPVVSDLPGTRWLAGPTGAYADTADAAAAALAALCDRAEAVRRGEQAAKRVRTLLAPAAPLPQLLAAYERRG